MANRQLITAIGAGLTGLAGGYYLRGSVSFLNSKLTNFYNFFKSTSTRFFFKRSF
jgi:hypothetical protein